MSKRIIEDLQYKKTIPIRLSSIRDLVRMASSVAMMQPTYIIRYKNRDGKTILGFLAVFRDYYNYYGLPMFYYVIDENDTLKDASYVLVKLDDAGERIEPSKTTRPGYVAVPIINVDKAPEFLLPQDVE